MNRSEHLQWAKGRAMEYLERGELQNAFASFVSDMGKHPETASHMALQSPMAGLGVDALMRGDAVELRKYIEGFN
jgi:hypothetical protein